MKKPSIMQYLLTTCLFTIDELNGLYGSLSKDELMLVAAQKFNEMDITVRLGYPFRHMVHYESNSGPKKGIKINHDLYVETKEFEIEIKYLRNYDSEFGTKTNRQPWGPIQQDFDWIIDEISRGNKGKRAFVIGWFNFSECFAQAIQLGKTTGKNPSAHRERVALFPFLNKEDGEIKVNSLTYNYETAYDELLVEIQDNPIENLNCMFLGNESDVFHFAIYY